MSKRAVSGSAEEPGDMATWDHARFRELDRFLRAGDVLVVNASQAVAASLPARHGADPAVPSFPQEHGYLWHDFGHSNLILR